MKTLTDWLRSKGFTPDNIQLYYEACTHSSYANEHHSGIDNNERLEFVGDAVLQIWSATALYKLMPKLHEGKMTTIRAQTVCESTLAKLNEQLGWYKFLRLGVGEEKAAAVCVHPFWLTILKPASVRSTWILAMMQPQKFSMST